MVAISQISAGLVAGNGPPGAASKASAGTREAAAATREVKKPEFKPPPEGKVLDPPERKTGVRVEIVVDNNASLNISFDDRANRFVIRGIDDATGKIVNQFPPEELLKLIARSREQFFGLIFDETA